MLVIVDDRSLVTAGYEGGFRAEGVSTTGFRPQEFREWFESASDADLAAIEAFLLGDSRERIQCAKFIRGRSKAPVIAINETPSLEQTLALFAAGVDDVVRKPIHIRELLARIGAIRRRTDAEPDCAVLGELRVYFDGRDPEIGGKVLRLPRRERRILEYLIKNRGRRVSKAQIFNAIYGIFDDNVEETVVESHVSKLRKNLRRHLGFDPIDSKRYLGYCIDMENARQEAMPAEPLLVDA